MMASDFSAILDGGRTMEPRVLNDDLLNRIRDLHSGPDRVNLARSIRQLREDGPLSGA